MASAMGFDFSALRQIGEISRQAPAARSKRDGAERLGDQDLISPPMLGINPCFGGGHNPDDGRKRLTIGSRLLGAVGDCFARMGNEIARWSRSSLPAS